ncbi:MAG TPA: hypothetical protein VNB90_07220 [Cytophagaceae bacterium]|nr:hypothetical protein [Cytophagaceae bacterium]
MKRIRQSLALSAICIIIIALSSCSKKNDPAPSSSSNTQNNTTNNTTVSTDNPMCGDSICKVPFRILSAFIPSGFYDTGDQSTDLLVDSCGEVTSYPGEDLRIRYTKGTMWGWGAHFLNNNNWGGTFKITPAATKITLYVKINYSANVTFNAFGDQQYGKVELYKRATPVATPVWEKITIPLSGKPPTFAAPLNIVIDGVDNQGTVTIVDIKDVLIE